MAPFGIFRSFFEPFKLFLEEINMSWKLWISLSTTSFFWELFLIDLETSYLASCILSRVLDKFMQGCVIFIYFCLIFSSFRETLFCVQLSNQTRMQNGLWCSMSLPWRPVYHMHVCMHVCTILLHFLVEDKTL